MDDDIRTQNLMPFVHPPPACKRIINYAHFPVASTGFPARTWQAAMTGESPWTTGIPSCPVDSVEGDSHSFLFISLLFMIWWELAPYCLKLLLRWFTPDRQLRNDYNLRELTDFFIYFPQVICRQWESNWTLLLLLQVNRQVEDITRCLNSWSKAVGGNSRYQVRFWNEI